MAGARTISIGGGSAAGRGARVSRPRAPVRSRPATPSRSAATSSIPSSTRYRGLPAPSTSIAATSPPSRAANGTRRRCWSGLTTPRPTSGLLPRRRPALRRLPHRRVEGAAVEQQVLADDKARRGGAEEGAGIAELGRVADAAGRGGRAALGELLLERDVLALRLVGDAALQPVGQERPGQEPVDRHVVFGDLAGEAGAERGEPRAGAVGHAEI